MKIHIIITCYRRWLVCGQIRTEATITKEKEIKENTKEKKNKIKKRITEANQEWCDWKFQIHWNKLELVNTRSRDERENPFCVSSKNKLF